MRGFRHMPEREKLKKTSSRASENAMRIYDPGIDRSSGDAATSPVAQSSTSPLFAPPLTASLLPAQDADRQILYTWDLAERSFRFGEGMSALLQLKQDSPACSEQEWTDMID